MNDNETGDDRCMRAVASGDQTALRELFDRWKLPVVNYCYRACGSHIDAEEILLKTFEEIWRIAPRYEARGTFSAWLFTIVRGKLQHHWRNQSRRLPQALPAALLTTPGGTQEAVETSGDPAQIAEREDALVQSLQALPIAQRDALLLSIHSQMPGAQIAESLGITLQNFHVLVHRARHALKLQLEAILK